MSNRSNTPNDKSRTVQDIISKIEQKSQGGGYIYRGEAWLHLQEWEKAKSDLITAKDMGMDIIASFNNEYASIADFEQKTGIQLPEDIAAMLTPPQS